MPDKSDKPDNSKIPKSLTENLIAQASLISTPEYEEYRMNLRQKLLTSKRNAKLAFHVCWVSFFLSIVLMFVGGTKVVGAFDPYEADANFLSVTLGSLY